jgi:tetratricopeptide (TPR) repeat protein
MMHVEKVARQRFAILGSVVFLFLGGMMLTGLVQRFVSPSEGAEEITHEAVLEEARKTRAIRSHLAQFGQKGQWSATIAAADDALKVNENSLIRGLRAEAILLSGDWNQARAEYQKVLNVNEPLLRASYYQYAEDPKGYHEMCEKLMADVNIETLPPLFANNAAWMCVLGPDALSDYTKPRLLAEKAVKAVPPEDRPNNLNTLGAVLYRMGRNQDAIDRLMEADKQQPNPFNWVFLAMAHHRLGHQEEARRLLTRLQERIQETFASKEQQDSRHELMLLLHEAEQTINQP